MKNHKCVQRDGKSDDDKKKERVRWILRIVGTHHLCVMMVNGSAVHCIALQLSSVWFVAIDFKLANGWNVENAKKKR